ncbi:MAG: MFS transporter [Rhizobiaceae bacterium]|nr:MFS transporter [Hyphomicrobiales bacterium]NRB31092.1 MFS transporter [Rhizobiaceae bacterium]
MITLPLAIAQTVIWASIFYIFPALLPTWERETDWTKTELTGAFTLSLLVAALTSPLAGRLIDRGLGRELMLGGTLLSIACLLILSQVQTLLQFYAVWLVMGLGMSASLYEPCFANLIRHLTDKAKPTITRITLLAGLAGTVAFPTAHWLTSIMGWQQAVMAFAAGVALTTLPLTAIGLTRLQRQYPVSKPAKTDLKSSPPFTLVFWFLAIAFLIISFVHGMIITHLLPLLAERSVPVASAILIASCIGPMQVFGRLVMVATERHVSTQVTNMACFLGMAIGVSALTVAGANLLLIGLFVVIHGSAYGVISIVRPVLTREVLGSKNFGEISGRIGGLSIFGTAIAPFAGSLIWQFAGYSAMLVLSIILLLVGVGLLQLAIWRGRSMTPPEQERL